MNLPTALIRKLHDVHEDAAPWLTGLDELLAGLETRWNIRITGLVGELSYNVVAFAEGSDGTPYVLKLSPPSDDFTREVEALRLYDGDGMCRLIQADETIGAALLERLHPGVSLWTTDDDAGATRIAAELMQRLWRPVTDSRPFRSLRSWARELYSYPQKYPNGTDALPRQVTEKAITLFDDLLQDPQPPVLLHADLHHGNILSAARAPHLAIDPKGIVGPRGYDVATFLRNPYGVERRPDLRRILDTRVNIFSVMLGLSPHEVAAWGFAHGVLSMVWSLTETNPDISGEILVLRELERWL